MGVAAAGERGGAEAGVPGHSAEADVPEVRWLLSIMFKQLTGDDGSVPEEGRGPEHPKDGTSAGACDEEEGGVRDTKVLGVAPTFGSFN